MNTKITLPEVKTTISLSTIIVSFVMLISMIVTGLGSFHFFRQADYNAWALVTLSCFLSIVLFINILSDKKTAMH